MNPTFERLLEEKLFQKNFKECDTLEKQIKFCEAFLDKHGPLPSRTAIFGGPRSYDDHFMVQKNYTPYSTPWGNIDWLSCITTSPQDYYDTDLIQQELATGIVNELCKSKALQFQSQKDHMTRLLTHKVKVGVLVPK